MSDDRSKETPEVATERPSNPGDSPPPGGDGDYDHGVEESPAGHSTSGDGSGTDGGHRGSRSPERIKWAGVAAAFVTVVVLLSQIYGDVTGNHEQSDKIIEKVQQLPGAVEKVQDLKDSVDDLQDQIKDQPTPMSTTIIQKGQPGQPGQPGKPGQVVTSPPKTKYIETPGPTKTVRPSAQPTCNTSLIGTCIVP